MSAVVLGLSFGLCAGILFELRRARTPPRELALARLYAWSFALLAVAVVALWRSI